MTDTARIQTEWMYQVSTILETYEASSSISAHLKEFASATPASCANDRKSFSSELKTVASCILCRADQLARQRLIGNARLGSRRRNQLLRSEERSVWTRRRLYEATQRDAGIIFCLPDKHISRQNPVPSIVAEYVAHNKYLHLLAEKCIEEHITGLKWFSQNPMVSAWENLSSTARLVLGIVRHLDQASLKRSTLWACTNTRLRWTVAGAAAECSLADDEPAATYSTLTQSSVLETEYMSLLDRGCLIADSGSDKIRIPTTLLDYLSKHTSVEQTERERALAQRFVLAGFPRDPYLHEQFRDTGRMMLPHMDKLFRTKIGYSEQLSVDVAYAASLMSTRKQSTRLLKYIINRPGCSPLYRGMAALRMRTLSRIHIHKGPLDEDLLDDLTGDLSAIAVDPELAVEESRALSLLVAKEKIWTNLTKDKLSMSTDLARSVVTEVRSSPQRTHLVDAASVQALLACATAFRISGEVSEADESLDSASELATQAQIFEMARPDILTERAAIMLTTSSYEAVIDLLVPGNLTGTKKQRVIGLVYLAEAHLALEQFDMAKQYLAESQTALQSFNSPPSVAALQIHICFAKMHYQQGDLPSTESHLQLAVACLLNVPLGAGFVSACIYKLSAHILRRLGQHETALLREQCYAVATCCAPVTAECIAVPPMSYWVPGIVQIAKWLSDIDSIERIELEGEIGSDSAESYRPNEFLSNTCLRPVNSH